MTNWINKFRAPHAGPAFLQLTMVGVKTDHAEVEAGAGVLLGVVSARLGLDHTLEHHLSQVSEALLEGQALLVRVEGDGVDDPLVEDLEHAEVVLQAVADQDRLGVQPLQDVRLHLGQALLGRALEAGAGDPGVAGVEVELAVVEGVLPGARGGLAGVEGVPGLLPVEGGPVRLAGWSKETSRSKVDWSSSILSASDSLS